MPKKSQQQSSVIPSEHIEQTIYFIRDQKVMLDRDLAELYGVETKNLNKAVARNIERFPEDFMFQLTASELENWKFQIGTSNSNIKMGLRKLPCAFTEQGVAMLSGVLRSQRAVKVNIEIMRTFVRFRHVLSSQKEMLKIVAELRSFVMKKTNKTDQEIRKIWEAIEKLSPPDEGRPYARQTIGFKLVPVPQ
jgi:hypothetical protein